jgi:putative copper export protein
VGAALAVATTVLAVGVQGALLSGLGIRALADLTVIRGVLVTSFGVSALVRLAGLAVLLVALPRLWGRGPTVASGLGAAAVIISFALTGHTISTEPRWLVVAANLSHTVAGAAWFGGLVLLAVALRGRRAADDAAGGGRLVARFSGVASVAVVLVTVAGTALAWSEVRALRALTSTTYGLTLLAKVALVAAVVALGAYNNRRLVPAVARRAEGGWDALRRTVRYEVVGIVAVLGLTGFLANLVPARTEAGVSGPYSETVDLGGDYDLTVTVDPNRAGTNEVHLYLLREDGRPSDAAREVTLELSLPANDIAPIERTPQVAGPGHWLLTGPELSIPGQWDLEVTARVGDFEQLTAAVPIRVNA